MGLAPQMDTVWTQKLVKKCHKNTIDNKSNVCYNVLQMEVLMMQNSITVRLPKKLQTQLQSISKEERIPISDLVRDSLNRYIAIHRFRRLRSKVLPFAEAQGLLTDEDVFKTIS